MEQES
ncbi:hypothetical protein Nmel_015284 [Mimus melanotis]